MIKISLTPKNLQVAILKEERSNLLVENEELYGKVREAQTLSRKDSVKAKQLETEVDHLKDEFDRLRILYESTRDHIDNMEVKILRLSQCRSKFMEVKILRLSQCRSKFARLKSKAIIKFYCLGKSPCVT